MPSRTFATDNCGRSSATRTIRCARAGSAPAARAASAPISIPDRLRAPLMRHKAARRGKVGRGDLGRGARVHRRAHADDQGEVRTGSGRPVQPRHRRDVPQAHAQGVRHHQQRGSVVCTVPRSSRRGLQPDVRRGNRLTRTHRHPQCPLPGADRLAPRREHAQHAGAGVRGGERQRRDDHRGGPALLDCGEQGEALPAREAGYGPRAVARLDERPRDRGPVRHGLRHEARLRLRLLQGRTGAVHAGVGLSGDGDRARSHPRNGARNGVPPSRDAGAPGTPCHLVWRRRAAQPRHRAAQCAARQLGSQGRLLLPVEHGRAGLSVSALPAVGTRQGGQPEPAVSFRDGSHHHGHPRGDDHRRAVSDQGLVRVRDQPDPRDAEPGRNDPRHPCARPARRRGRHPVGDRGVGGCRAARGHLPRAL